MKSSLYLGLLSIVVAALVVGCNNGKDKDLHGNSTRTASAAPAGYTAFGEPMKLDDRQAVPVGTVLADVPKYEGKYVRMVGSVDKVCTSKGCWLEMSDVKTSEVMFVKFTCPVDGRLIPMEAVGKPVVVEGYVKVKEISEEDARHLKEESGASAEEVAKIKGPQKQITLESPAARVAGL